MGVVEERRSDFESLVARVGPPLRGYLLRRTDRDTAEDVLADTLLVLWRRRDDVPAAGELPWCYGVARRCLANAQRAERRRHRLVLRLGGLARPHDQPYGGPPEVPDPDVRRALAVLGERDRELLMLWAWEDLAPADLARTLGVTVGAVHVRLHRARRRFAVALAAGEAGAVDAVPGATAPEVGKPAPAAGHGGVEERRGR